MTDLSIDDVKENDPSVMRDYYDDSIKAIDEFVERSESLYGYDCPDYPLFSKYMEGLTEGLYLFAAQSNVGKTATMTNIARAFCKHKPNKLFMVYYSLDDTKEQVIPRLISMEQLIPISVSAKPSRYQKLIDEGANNSATYVSWLNKRDEGIAKLKASNKEMIIVDAEQIRTGEQLLAHAKNVQMFVKTHDLDNNIIVCIDSISDLIFEDSAFTNATDVGKNDYISQEVKRWAQVELKVPIFCSIHLRKVLPGKRATIEDMKSSGRYHYDSKVAFVLNNRVSSVGESADIYINDPNFEGKQPVIEMQWAKNKASGFKRRTYYAFAPEYSKVTECNKQQSSMFDSIINAV